MAYSFLSRLGRPTQDDSQKEDSEGKGGFGMREDRSWPLPDSVPKAVGLLEKYSGLEQERGWEESAPLSYV